MIYQYIAEKIKRESKTELREWLEEVENDNWISSISCMGWLKIAWTYGFLLLKNNRFDYANEIRGILIRGGDTDTNCCIVGGLIGAVIGYEKLPEQYVDKMLKCDSTKSSKQFKRPSRFNPSRCLDIVDKLMSIAPKSVEIVPNLESIFKV
jgi:ADP-ribosyl-[dinitrogen reductase] hydrolase